MAQTTAQGSGSTNNNTGAIYTGGTINSTLFGQVSLGVKMNGNGGLAMTKNSGIVTGLKGASTTITSVANGSGFCVFTLNSHGLVVGDIIEITGATAASLNTVHNITAKDTNTFTTDIAYTASGTAGDFQKLTGTRNVLSDYIVPTVANSIAGVANTALATAGGFGLGSAGIARSVTERRYNITSWNYTTGAATKGANAGDSWTFATAQGTGSVDNESLGVGYAVIYDGSLTPSGVQYTPVF